ncbi:uncharacterized protein BDZ99DRAFT_516947 [Mytilinidion resinicola]|uniref:Uncharacterized protein n=1 Tax=Mytilinidion resinicola TaxID=574789 RepID=A0A6A6YZJ4_9PEZI|nr:uncharacterized protein BDZ99DRAFT_516947 [Mytilinidion resinicola]KAF2814342.1 hypothetical protein BDZ99DRAFT_516947 [Mytilinidion resinicola]
MNPFPPPSQTPGVGSPPGAIPWPYTGPNGVNPYPGPAQGPPIQPGGPPTHTTPFPAPYNGNQLPPPSMVYGAGAPPGSTPFPYTGPRGHKSLPGPGDGAAAVYGRPADELDAGAGAI